MNTDIKELDSDELEELVMAFYEKMFELLNIPYTFKQLSNLDEDEIKSIYKNNSLNKDNILELRKYIFNEVKKYGVDIKKYNIEIEELFKLLFEFSSFKINYT